MKRLSKGRNEARQRAPEALRREVHILARRQGGRHPTLVNLAQVEDEAAREDRRDPEEHMARVSINGDGCGRLSAHGSRNMVT